MSMCDRCRVSGCLLNYNGKACEKARQETCPDVYYTNADHIRSMTDEELCDFILEKRENGTCYNNRCYVNDPDKGCDDCTMDWLKQPYKKGEAE